MLDKNDEKIIQKIVLKTVLEALDQVVLPQLQEIRDDVSVLKGDVSVLKGDNVDLKENVSILQDTTYRMETKLDAEVKRKDVLSSKIEQIDKRVLRLESKKI